MNQGQRLLLAAAACLAGMLAIAAAVTRFGDPDFDASIDRTASDLRDTWFGDLLRVLTDLGYLPWYPMLVAAVVAGMFVAGRRREIAALVASVLLAWGGFVAFKAAFRRARPELADYVAGGWSMPSGHASLAFALATGLLLAVPALRRWWTVALLAAYAVLTAVSRVVLGVHYSTDILAGALLGCACAFAVFGAVDLLRSRRSGRVSARTRG